MRVPVFGALALALKSESPSGIELEIVASKLPPSDPQQPVYLERVQLKTFLPLFVHFYATQEAWVKNPGIGKDLALADLLILSLEMSDELNQLGCPLSP